MNKFSRRVRTAEFLLVGVFAAVARGVFADVPSPAFVWSPSATADQATTGGATDSSGKWTTSISMGGGQLRIAPSGSGYVFDLANTPYSSVSVASSAFSFSLYGDAYRMSGGKQVLAMFGSSNGSNPMLVMYSEGGSLRLAFIDKSWSVIGTAAELAMPTDDAVHLYTMAADPADGALALYIDGGAGTDQSAVGSAGGSQTLDTGFQLGSLHGGNKSSGFVAGDGFAMVSALGFDFFLAQSDVASLSASYPSYQAVNTFSGNVDSSIGNGYSLTVYDGAAATDQMYFGITRGTLNIPAGSVVTVPAVRILNDGNTGCSATLDLGGTLVVTSVSTDPNVWNERNSYKGILWGHWHGTGTYNITGSLLATNAYLETVFTAETQTINITDGGLLKARGLYAANGNSTVNIRRGGTLEVSECPSGGSAMAKNFGWGTFRAVGSVTETDPVTFDAASGKSTTLDPVNAVMTFAPGTVNGSGDIKIEASDGGTVVMQGVSGYTGTITVEAGTLDFTVSQEEFSLGHTFDGILVRDETAALVLRAPDGTVASTTRTTTDGMSIYTIPPGGKVWNNAAGDGLLSTRENWPSGFPDDGEPFRIVASRDLTVYVDRPIAAGRVVVTGGGTVTFDEPDSESRFTVSNLVIQTPVVVAGYMFQPNAVTFEESGSLEIAQTGFLGDAVFEYSGTLPTAGDAFTPSNYCSRVTSAERWNGTIYFRNMAVTDFSSSPYGNASSALRLTGVSGWLSAPSDEMFVNTTPLELVNDGSTIALSVNNGNSASSSAENKGSYFPALRGSGTLAGSGSGTLAVMVFGDASEFTGGIALNNKVVVFGDEMPDFSKLATGRIIVGEGKSVTVPASNAAWWSVGGIYVDGEITMRSLDHIGGGTVCTVGDTGVFTLVSTGNNGSDSENFSRITGTGTLRLVSDGGDYYRFLTRSSYPTGMLLDNELGAGLLLSVKQAAYTVGSLSGTGDIRSDWSTSGDDRFRSLTVQQGVNATWSGVFRNADCISTVTVGPGTSGATGTLTIAGDQLAYNETHDGMSHSNDLSVVTGGSVAITGNWVGPVSVEGALGGTGTIDGNVVLTNGATLVTSGDGSSLLRITGTLSVHDNLTIQLPAGYDLAANTGRLLVNTYVRAAAAEASTFTIKIGDDVVSPQRYRISATTGGLRLTSRDYTEQPFRVILR